MKSVSTRLEDETYRLIAETADERDVSKAEVLRELVEKGIQYNDLKRENDRLRNEKRTIINQREEHTELVRTVERQQSLAERKAEAGLLTKTKWALFGMNVDDEKED